MGNMKIGARLAAGYVVLLLMMAVIAGTSYFNVQRLSLETTNLIKDKWVKSVLVNELMNYLDDISVSVRDMVLSDDAGVKKAADAHIAATSEKIDKHLEKLDRMITSETGKKHLLAIRESRAAYRTELANVLELAQSATKKKQAIAEILGELARKKGVYAKAVDELSSFQDKEVERVGAECENIAGTTNTITLIVGIIALIVGIIIARQISLSITRPIDTCLAAARKIASGDMNVEFSGIRNDETGELQKAMARMTDAIKLMVDDAKSLTAAATEGKLSSRVDAGRHAGEFAAIIGGFNTTLDAIIGPLNVSAEYMDRISKGDIPPRITDSYNGDFNEIKNNLNVCIDAIAALVADGKVLTVAAQEGRLDVRADVSRHEGDFRVVIQGFNNTLDAILGPLNVSAEYMDRISKGDIPPRITDNYNGDFNEIKNNLNVCIGAIAALITDANMLAGSASEGKLSTRVDTSYHQGDFRRIIQGLNNTMDAMVSPINEVRIIMEAMAGGELSRRMTGEAHGDFAVLKDSLNNALNNLSAAIGNVTQNARQVASASAQTSGAVGQISDGSQNQLHAISQVASAIKQTAASIADVSRNTEDASMRAKDSVSIVNEGQAKMAQMVAVVNNIATNSEKINKITDVIEKIANKTNLLSLNAAIEAARAGEHGRGFAVVAEEVGKLAANAAESTQEIVALVYQAVKEANHAVSTVNEVSDGMRRISDGALQTETMLQRISAALEEQSAAVQEVNSNIASLNKVAESNAAASEEITATVVELARLADNTRKEAERFQV